MSNIWDITWKSSLWIQLDLVTMTSNFFHVRDNRGHQVELKKNLGDWRMTHCFEFKGHQVTMERNYLWFNGWYIIHIFSALALKLNVKNLLMTLLFTKLKDKMVKLSIIGNGFWVRSTIVFEHYLKNCTWRPSVIN